MKIVIHPGMGRTGTTTLQNQIFETHPQILNLGQPKHNTKEYQLFFKALLFEEDIAWKKHCLGLSRLVNASDQPLCVISDENLSSGEVWSLAARRLKELFPEAVVLFTIRNQIDALISNWMQEGYLNKSARSGRNCYVPFVNYMQWHQSSLEKRYKTSIFTKLDYWALVQTYEFYFPGRVHVLLFEEMKENPKKFFCALEKILEITDGSISEKSCNLQKQNASNDNLNFVRNRLAGILPNKILSPLMETRIGQKCCRKLLEDSHKGAKALCQTQELQNFVYSVFAEGNAKLASKFGLDLKRWAYPVEK